MAPKKIVVFGVTGTQGGSVARALLEQGDEFEVWGVSRSRSSKKAQALEKLGVKIIEGDLDTPASYEPGLKGADNVWINADFWLYYDGTNADEAGAREAKQNKNVVAAAKGQGVPHVVFSSLYDFGDKFPIPHCDSKVEVCKYIESLNYPHTYVFAVWYFSNVLLFDRTKEGDKYVMKWPMPDSAYMTGFAAEQIGQWALLAFKDPKAWEGKEIHCDAEHMTPPEMCAVLSDVLGKTIETAHVTREIFDTEIKAALPGELYQNYSAILDGDMKYDVELAHKLNPRAYDFKQWCEANLPALKERFA